MDARHGPCPTRQRFLLSFLKKSSLYPIPRTLFPADHLFCTRCANSALARSPTHTSLFAGTDSHLLPSPCALLPGTLFFRCTTQLHSEEFHTGYYFVHFELLVRSFFRFLVLVFGVLLEEGKLNVWAKVLNFLSPNPPLFASLTGFTLTSILAKLVYWFRNGKGRRVSGCGILGRHVVLVGL